MKVAINYKVLIFIFLSLVPFLYIIMSLKNTFLDDAYITLTYSKHFFEYGKPYYNISDTVQGNGQTSVFWMLLQSFFFNFKSINPVLVNKIISSICALIILFYSYKAFLKAKNLFSTALNVLFLLFLSIWSALNVSHGLETIIYSLALFLFLKLRNTKFIYLIVFLLPFIRPEALVFVIVFIFDTNFFTKEFFKRVIWSCLCIICYISYFAIYYDVLIPLPFILKNSRNFSFIKIENFFIVSLIFTPLWYFLLNNKRRLKLYLPLIFFLIYYSFFIDEVMNTFDRYRFPLMMYFLFFLLNEKYEIDCENKFMKFCMIISMFFIGKSLIILNNKKNIYKYIYSVGMENGPKYIGKFLHEKSLEEKRKLNIINSDAGAIAFFSDCNLYDTWGLNNANLLLYKKNNDWISYLKYLKTSNPDYIILISKSDKEYIPNLKFEEKIYSYFNLSSKIPISKRKFENQYYYFIYKIK